MDSRPSTKSLLLRGALWTGSAKILVSIIGLVSTVILARLLLPEDFGLVAIASALAMMIATITELSLSQALVQHDDPTEEHYHSAFTLNLLRGIVLALFIAVISWPTAALYGDSRLTPVILMLALGALVGGVANPKLAHLERRLEFRQFMILSLAEKSAGFVVAISIALAFQSYWALVLGQLASQVGRSAASFFVTPYRPAFTIRHWRDLFSFSIWLTLGQAVQAINWRSDPLVLGFFLPTRVLGYFSMGGRIAGMALSDVLHPIAQILFPAFAQLKNDPNRMRAAYVRAHGVVIMIALPLGLGLASIAQPLVALLLGQNWMGVVPVLQLLAVSTIITRFVSADPVALATGNTKALFHRDLISLGIRIPLLFLGMLLAPILNYSVLNGALAGMLLSAILCDFLWNMTLLAKISAITIRDQLGAIWRPACSGFLMLAIVTGVSGNLEFEGTFAGLIMKTMLCVALGGVTYVFFIASLWFLNGRPQGPESEILEIVRKYITPVNPNVS